LTTHIQQLAHGEVIVKYDPANARDLSIMVRYLFDVTID
jgi:hypothetical protein